MSRRSSGGREVKDMSIFGIGEDRRSAVKRELMGQRNEKKQTRPTIERVL